MVFEPMPFIHDNVGPRQVPQKRHLKEVELNSPKIKYLCAYLSSLSSPCGFNFSKERVGTRILVNVLVGNEDTTCPN